ncbi:MAG TPA: cytochrome c biogenesis protein CcdA [Desulfobacterales bacterium]|nr:cytochrome c biogenesis protein CcdA [Desulfobacterales bacterium]
MFTETISYPAALLAGLISFFSPCILPLMPAYFSFITGVSLEDLTGEGDKKLRKKILFSTLLFVFGFSFIFILLGASASYLGGLIYRYKKLIIILGGVLIVIFGIHLIGIFRIRYLHYDKRIHLGSKPLHFLGSFIVGMAFGAGWSPCIGPILGSMLIIAGSKETVWQGILLLSVYSVGLAIPFIILSVFINFLLRIFYRITPIMKYINGVAGILLILVGIFLISNNLPLLSIWD